MNKWSL